LVANAMAERHERLLSDASFGDSSVSALTTYAGSPFVSAGSLAEVRARLGGQARRRGA
jgi:hypothetical protein